MALAVDRYELGPIGTNCYVVRADRGATEAVVDRPGRRRRRAPARARPDGRDRAPAILVTHTHCDHLGARRRPRRGHRRAGLRLRGGGAGRSSSPDDYYPGHARSARGTADAHARRRRDDRARRASRSRVARSRPLARATSPSTPTAALFSGDVLFAGSVGRTDLPFGDWETLLESIRALVERFPPETVVYSGPRPADDARRRARPQPVPRRAARAEVRGAPRHARHPPVRAAALAAGDRGDRAPLRALRLPPDRHAGLRGHGALRAHVRRGLGRRPEGDVHVQRPRRPLADAARRGDGADRARLPRARPAPRAAAAEALHDRADVPLRPPAEGALPRALAARRRGDRLRRPGDRRRGDPALRRAARAGSASPSTGSS